LRCCCSGRRSPLQNRPWRHGACRTGPSGLALVVLVRVPALGLGQVLGTVLGLGRVLGTEPGLGQVLGMGRGREQVLGLGPGLLAHHSYQEPS
jgi:hypothetical protein